MASTSLTFTALADSPIGLRIKKHWHVVVLTLVFLGVSLTGLASLPVIDRDEARFAQASVQMAESGDLLNIRFQDRARNKKPAGIYWLQTASLKVFSTPTERTLWAQRLPSVLGALLAVLATYWGGAKLVGRKAAFIGALAMALSLLLIFESHIAKTDAVLCGLGAVCFASIAVIRSRPSTGLSLWRAAPDIRTVIWAFWLALGFSVLIKGPVIPSLIALTLVTLLIWEKRGHGIRQLINIPAMFVSALIFIPWAIAIGLETQGAFFAESLGKDFGGKLVSAQESHPGPFGYHFGAIWLTLWPGSLLLIPGFYFAFHILKKNKTSPSPIAKSIRLCLAWIIPYWLLIEIMPTKLPHYALPLFPALCLLIGLAAVGILKGTERKISRFIGGLAFILSAFAIIIGLLTGKILYGGEEAIIPVFTLALVAGLLAFISGFAFWFNKIKPAFITAAICAVTLNIMAYGFVLPTLSDLRLADRIETAFAEEGIALPRKSGPKVHALNFTEPSLVYRLGKDMRLGDQTDLSEPSLWVEGSVFIIDALENEGATLASFETAAQKNQTCYSNFNTIEGLNYSRGDDVELRLLRLKSCD